MGFTLILVVLCVLCALIQWSQRRDTGQAGMPGGNVSGEFKRQQTAYMIAYCCAVTADWLQGPYVYALYEYYKFSKQEIGILFIAGFGSSAIFGTFVGGFADKYGRKLSCQIYCITYALSCVTKHSSSFWWLLVGRLLGGISTSILFSCFESWLVGNHNAFFFPADWLNQTFSIATVGNAITAIASGWLGGFVRDTFDSLVAPFDLAIVFLIAASITISWKWQENKGDSGMGGMVLPSGKNDDRNKLKVALERMRRDPKIAVLGMIQSLFEGAMYIFVFMWTPKLEGFFKPLPHGRVFGCFMACMMLGSSSLKYLSSWQPPVKYLRELYVISGIMMAIPALGLQEGYSTVSCFFIFEWCCGLYFPSIGIVKSKYVPEEVRATIYNIFRIPLNVIVVAVLANLGSISDNFVFSMCSIFLFLAAILQHVFIGMVGDHEGKAASLAAAENLTAELSHLTHYEPGEGKE
uniref:Molybdate-anion transporter n=1 Tax=Hanusia phi TaxID=3032 RepID=A0A7S0F0G8_9CRYP|mmetsp:Transcript_34431/g.77642  ORF Transcript_34431/g.77642 Transcript_34431/m.77642 type:complete len:465 (+) Transcript_34431:160-1554(+)